MVSSYVDLGKELGSAARYGATPSIVGTAEDMLRLFSAGFNAVEKVIKELTAEGRTPTVGMVALTGNNIFVNLLVTALLPTEPGEGRIVFVEDLVLQLIHTLTDDLEPMIVKAGGKV